VVIGGGSRRSTPTARRNVVPVGAFWDNGQFYFTSGPGTRKSKNLATNPECVMSVATNHSTSPSKVAPIASPILTISSALPPSPARMVSQHAWENDAFTAEFSAPSAGPPPWYLYRVTAERVYALGTAEPYGATRFSF